MTKKEREEKIKERNKRSRASNLLVGQVRSGQVPYNFLLNVFFLTEKIDDDDDDEEDDEEEET